MGVVPKKSKKVKGIDNIQIQEEYSKDNGSSNSIREDISMNIDEPSLYEDSEKDDDEKRTVNNNSSLFQSGIKSAGLSVMDVSKNYSVYEIPERIDSEEGKVISKGGYG